MAHCMLAAPALLHAVNVHDWNAGNPACCQASFMARAQTMSSHCSGCGSPELALRFLRVAWAAVGFNLVAMAISSCAQGSGHNCLETHFCHCHGYYFQAGLLLFALGRLPCSSNQFKPY